MLDSSSISDKGISFISSQKHPGRNLGHQASSSVGTSGSFARGKVAEDCS